jgi:hypothetical protein
MEKTKGRLFMKNLIFITTLLVSLSALADSADTCKDAYKDGYTDLVEASMDFNHGRIGKGEFATTVAMISTEVSAVRAYCSVVEDPADKKCIQNLKKVYKDQREEIKVIAVLAGNQTSVKIMPGFDGIMNMLGGLIRCH